METSLVRGDMFDQCLVSKVSSCFRKEWAALYTLSIATDAIGYGLASRIPGLYRCKAVQYILSSYIRCERKFRKLSPNHRASMTGCHSQYELETNSINDLYWLQTDFTHHTR
jgi:hypothetical protein